MPTSTDTRTWSVSELNGIARSILETELADVWVEGELGNIARPASGHIYFTLKDDRAQIRCAMFRNRGRFLRFEPETGMRVKVNGRVSLYEPRGDYQLIVQTIEPAGEGALQQAFEKLKRKLFEEGLFDDALKKPLPGYPSTIGIVTSPSGAAIRDILQILQRRYPLATIVIYPVQVQGDAAAAQIVAAIEAANARNEVDLLIVSRGGGSLEDLWPFNDERVARAIHASALPVVSAIGHEIDFTITDFVADVRAPTPSAAAELVSPDSAELEHRLSATRYHLTSRIKQRLANLRSQLENLRQRLSRHSPMALQQQQTQRLDELAQRLERAIDLRLDQMRARLTALETLLTALTPVRRLTAVRERLLHKRHRLRQSVRFRLETKRGRLQQLGNALRHLDPGQVLERGYVIVRDSDTGRIISRAHELGTGDPVDLQFRDGIRKGEITQ